MAAWSKVHPRSASRYAPLETCARGGKTKAFALELATPSLKESQEDTCGRFMRTEPVRWYGRVRCTFGCAHAVVLYLYTPLQSPLEACFLFCK